MPSGAGWFDSFTNGGYGVPPSPRVGDPGFLARIVESFSDDERRVAEERAAREAEFDKVFGPRSSVMDGRPSTWSRVTAAARRLADNYARSAYRMGLGSDKWYARQLDRQMRDRIRGYRDKYPITELAIAHTEDDVLSRLKGSGQDRGDQYEHLASRAGAPVSSSWVGRTMGAYQRRPEELGLRQYEKVDDSAYEPWFGRVPGMETATDVGSYMLPFLGQAVFARDVAQQAGDGDYGTAAAFALAGPVMNRVSRLMSGVTSKVPWLNPAGASTGAGVAARSVGRTAATLVPSAASAVGTVYGGMKVDQHVAGGPEKTAPAYPGEPRFLGR